MSYLMGSQGQVTIASKMACPSSLVVPGAAESQLGIAHSQPEPATSPMERFLFGANLSPGLPTISEAG